MTVLVAVAEDLANPQNNQIMITTVSLSSEDEEKVENNTYVCKFCEQTVYPYVMPNPLSPQKMLVNTRLCRCVQKSLKAEEVEKRNNEQRKIIEKRFADSMLSERFKHCTFENWEHIKEVELMFREVRLFIDECQKRISKGDGLVLCGTPGIGKTHLLAAATKELINKGIKAVFINVPDMLKRIRATYDASNKDTEEELLRRLTTCDVLVLDDLGVEKHTAWMEETIYTIINRIYMNKKVVLATTNLKIDKLFSHIGDKTLDRLIEITRIIECEAPSYRRRLAREKMTI